MKIVLAMGSTMFAAMLFQAPATPPMKMGLWETTTSTKISGIEMPQGMAMPSRQVTARMCLTPDSYQKNLVQMDQRQKDCVRSNEAWKASGYAFDISCNTGRTKGHFDMTFDSKEASHGTMHLTTDGGGRSIVIDTSIASKFVSADCGSVTPDKPEVVR